MGCMSTMPSLAMHNVDVTTLNEFVVDKNSQYGFVWTKGKHSSCASSGDCLMYACSNYVSRFTFGSKIQLYRQVGAGGHRS